MIALTKEDDPRLQAGDTCLLFTAPWCGMCKMIHPAMEKAASFLAEISMLEVDCDKMANTAARFGVKALPTAVMIRDGQELRRLTGAAEVNMRNIQEAFRS